MPTCFDYRMFKCLIALMITACNALIFFFRNKQTHTHTQGRGIGVRSHDRMLTCLLALMITLLNVHTLD